MKEKEQDRDKDGGKEGKEEKDVVAAAYNDHAGDDGDKK